MLEHATPSQRRKNQPGKKYFRPFIEELEPRCVLSVLLQPNGGIVAGPDGNLWFSEFTGVARFNPSTGAVQEVLNLPFDNGVDGITVGADGNIWFTHGGGIGWINPSTGASQVINPYSGGEGQIISGVDGNIWFASLGDIVRLNPSTGQTSTFIAPGADFSMGNNLSGGIVSLADGSIWFSQVARQIDRLDPKTGAIQVFPFPGIYGSVAMTAGPDGNIWFTVGDVGIIKKIDPTTGVMLEYNAPAARGMTFGPDGNLWFTSGDMFGGGIGRLNPATGEVKRFDFSGIFEPDGPITVGPDGALWFTYHSGIARFDISTGTVQGFTLTANDSSSGNSGSSSSGTTPGSANSPSGSGSSVTAGIDFTRVVASFTDAVSNPLPTSAFSATIAWGDGVTTTGSIVANRWGEFDVVGSHKYAAAGTYEIKVTITITAGANDLSGSTITAFSTLIVDPLNFKPFN